MREIKFRAITPHGMCPVTQIKWLKNSNAVFVRLEGYPHKDEDSMIIIQKTHVLEFTGLKDKNDKEIYEGDIVKSTDLGDLTTEIFPIIYFSEEVKFCGQMKGGIRSIYGGDAWEYEVIGNIYRDPEIINENL